MVSPVSSSVVGSTTSRMYHSVVSNSPRCARQSARSADPVMIVVGGDRNWRVEGGPWIRQRTITLSSFTWLILPVVEHRLRLRSCFTTNGVYARPGAR